MEHINVNIALNMIKRFLCGMKSFQQCYLQDRLDSLNSYWKIWIALYFVILIYDNRILVLSLH